MSDSTQSRTPTIERYRLQGILKTTTSATGANWVNVGAAGGGPVNCSVIDVDNTTAVTLQFGIGAVGDTAPTGETFELASLVGKVFAGLDSSQQLFVRRNDQSGTQVTFKAIAYR